MTYREDKGLEQKPTTELDNLLNKASPDQLESYLSGNKEYLADEEKAFYYYMKDVLDEKNRKLRDLYIAAGVTDSYGGKIIRQESHTKNRDMILRLCLAGHFSLLETNRALKLYGMSELYAKDPRDACLIVAVNNRIYDRYDVDELLMQHGFSKLSKEE